MHSKSRFLEEKMVPKQKEIVEEINKNCEYIEDYVAFKDAVENQGMDALNINDMRKDLKFIKDADKDCLVISDELRNLPGRTKSALWQRLTAYYERIDELIFITILYCQVNQDHNNPKMGFQNVDFNSPSD